MRVMQNPVLKMMTRCLVRQYSWRPCVTKMTMAIVNQSDKTNMARKAYGQKKVTITFSDGGNAIFFSILRLTQIIWEIERVDEFCSLPIDVKKKSFAYCFGNLGLHDDMYLLQQKPTTDSWMQFCQDFCRWNQCCQLNKPFAVWWRDSSPPMWCISSRYAVDLNVKSEWQM